MKSGKSGQELDKAVQVAKNFASKNPDTLVLVLADHETGGFSIEEVNADDESGDGIRPFIPGHPLY